MSSQHNKPLSFVINLVIATLFTYLLSPLLLDLFYKTNTRLLPEAGSSSSLRSTLRGDYFDHKRSKLQYGGVGGAVEAGTVVEATAEFYRANGQPTQTCTPGNVSVTMTGPTTIPVLEKDEANCRTLSFSPRTAGQYSLRLTVDGRDITGSPLAFTVKASIVCEKTSTVAPHTVYDLAGTAANARLITVVLRDRFRNLLANVPSGAEPIVRVELSSVDGSSSSTTEGSALMFYAHDTTSGGQAHVDILLPGVGAFIGQVSVLSEGKWAALADKLPFIALSSKEYEEVTKVIAKGSTSSWFEGKMLSPGEYHNSTIYCYISNRRMSVRAAYMFFFTTRLHTVRISPVADLTMLPQTAANNMTPSISLCERGDTPTLVALPKRNVFYSVFAHHMQQR